MKRNIAVMLSIALIFALFTIPSFVSGEESGISVYYESAKLKFDVEPIIVDGRTMVPLRAIFEAFGMDVSWDDLAKKVTATKDNLKIELVIGSTSAYKNGKLVVIDVPSYIDGGRTMVPLRFIAESTGAEVTWNGTTKTVYISDGTSTKTDSGQSSSDNVTLTYKIVDTGLSQYFSDSKTLSKVSVGEDFYGQDANYNGYQPSYKDNGDGTVTDNVTGLMWQKDMAEKMSYSEAVSYANSSKLGGYDDWRIPNIKELFSLIQYSGKAGGEKADVLFIDTDYFDQPLGDTSIGEREIDAQVWSDTAYVGTTMRGDATRFGVNFVDGRIKGYSQKDPKTKKDNEMYFRLVRGNTDYGENIFVDNGDGTISDLATGLMWQASDDGKTRDWKDALAYAEGLKLAGHDDWRLPNAKELQSIVDYTRSVQTTDSPAIDKVFTLTRFTDEKGDGNYGFYWTGTTHMDGMNPAKEAAYVSFGEAIGKMNGTVMDVHGCGAVRSDPKSGDKSAYPTYLGPQGDIRYVYNYVLVVRDIK